ncbi:hypothetical protein AwDysgo_07670 [Bacteroidales bacterium]|nr:hypothetical protein AwDysgo_07670 [Bacteroidales bacterium]
MKRMIIKNNNIGRGIFFAILFCCTGFVFAQSEISKDFALNDKDLEYKSAVDVGSAKDHWYITLSGGVANLMSEETRYIGTSAFVPTMGLSVGKWITPIWGLRMNLTTSKLTGYTTWNDAANVGLGSWYIGYNFPYPGDGGTGGQSASNTYLAAGEGGHKGEFIKERFFGERKDTDKYGTGYMFDVPYMAGSIDFMLNLTNIFVPYDDTRFFNATIYGGLGFSHTFGNKTDQKTNINNTMQKFGFVFDFRLSDAWSINLEPQMLIVPENFDWRVGDGNTMDGIANYTLGLTYRFKERKFKTIQYMDFKHMSDLNNKINARYM